MKLDRNYKMTKLTKIMLGGEHDESHKATMRSLFTEAEYAYSNNKRKMSVKHVEERDTEE